MDWQQRMSCAIGVIETRLDQDLDWEEVARAAHCSLFHFLRMFEVITGVTAGEYVRRRRLTKAALEIASGDLRIIDVAIRFGYDSPDAFTKAFRKLFGCTPSEARLPGARLRSYPPISFSITLKGQEAMNYRIDTLPPFSLTGVCLHTSMQSGVNFREIPAFWERCMADGTFAKLAALAPNGSKIGVAGVCTNFDHQADTFDYLIAIETPASGADLPPGSVEVAVSGATWGAFECHGPLPGSIQGTMQRIFGEWFPTSGWEHADGPELEVYSPGDTTAPDYYCEVWVPLKRPVAQ